MKGSDRVQAALGAAGLSIEVVTLEGVDEGVRELLAGQEADPLAGALLPAAWRFIEDEVRVR